MLQRIQTIYLLLAAVLTIAAMCLPLATLYTNGILTGTAYALGVNLQPGVMSIVSFVLFGLSTAILLINIFQFKHRPLQIKFCIVAELLLLVATLLIAYAIYATGQEMRPTVFASFPVVAIVLTIMASSRIKHDERLVRSADRLR